MCFVVVDCGTVGQIGLTAAATVVVVRHWNDFGAIRVCGGRHCFVICCCVRKLGEHWGRKKNTCGKGQNSRNKKQTKKRKTGTFDNTLEDTKF